MYSIEDIAVCYIVFKIPFWFWETNFCDILISNDYSNNLSLCQFDDFINKEYEKVYGNSGTANTMLTTTFFSFFRYVMIYLFISIYHITMDCLEHIFKFQSELEEYRYRSRKDLDFKFLPQSFKPVS